KSPPHPRNVNLRVRDELLGSAGASPAVSRAARDTKAFRRGRRKGRAGAPALPSVPLELCFEGGTLDFRRLCFSSPRPTLPFGSSPCFSHSELARANTQNGKRVTS